MAKDSEKSVGGGLMGILQPLLGKVKSVNPQAAKTSATRSATGTKDLVQMSIAYLKQETQAPLKGIAKYVSFGLAAALFFSTGSVLLMLGLLRGMQSAWAYERADERGVHCQGRLLRAQGRAQAVREEPRWPTIGFGDNMAFVGILSTMLIDQMFIRGHATSARPAIEPVSTVRPLAPVA